MNWHQIIIPDPEALSGQSAQRLLTDVIGKTSTHWVMVDDLDGAILGLREWERVAISSKHFLALVAAATQYDWAFFFLYDEKPKPWPDGSTDRDHIAGARITVQMVDGSDFFVFTQDQALTAHLMREYPTARHSARSLNDLQIPK
jgi:hypothetical protein